MQYADYNDARSELRLLRTSVSQNFIFRAVIYVIHKWLMLMHALIYFYFFADDTTCLPSLNNLQTYCDIL